MARKGKKEASGAAKLNDADPISTLSKQLESHSGLEGVRNFCDHPIQDIDPILEEVVGVVVDLEWHINKPEGKINEMGLATFPMAQLRDCQTSSDFLRLLITAEVYHFRIVETCHMRNSGEDGFGVTFYGVERHSLFAPTRFVRQEMAINIFNRFLGGMKCEDGSVRPVIVIAHGWQQDRTQLKNEWDIKFQKDFSIVKTIDSITSLIIDAGILGKSDQSRKEDRWKFHELLTGFGIETTDLYLHNAGNDAVYELFIVFLVALFDKVYTPPILRPIALSANGMDPHCLPRFPSLRSQLRPATIGRLPSDFHIAELSPNEILAKFIEAKKSGPTSSWGYAKFCPHCEVSDDHEAEECEADKSLLECTLCRIAPGEVNEVFRATKNRVGHTAGRCVRQYSFIIPPMPSLPDWMTVRFSQANLAERLTPSRAVALNDSEVLSLLMCGKTPIDGLTDRDGVILGRQVINDEEAIIWGLEIQDDDDVATLPEVEQKTRLLEWWENKNP
ncbi:hypothetical protein P280DRAFT_535984 [Massarina eburnea CBS 473.64]|uniref:Gfd2/YDR514C-like C-terminal domain-containing protein n=1 Tax=Massarina eburnea CBS 473.64 TaxID=1395130 RepID=A0A6A6RKA8_9PLEO|nr:hypothetical protein P280DRAFT_535984 [Massarina eburnea CBS 473.64]